MQTEWLYGDRVILRPYSAGFSEEEMRRLYEWSRDTSVLRWSGGSPLKMSFLEFKSAFQEEISRHDRHRVIFGILTHDGQLIGRTGYFNIDWYRKEAELGIVIGDKAYWGRGYGTDAVNTLLRHIFTSTPLDRIYLFTYAENERAQRCFRKCGFRYLGRTRKFSLNRGTHEEIQMEIRRGQWLAWQRERFTLGDGSVWSRIEDQRRSP